MSEDVRLIDEAVEALAAGGWPQPLRRTPTQLVCPVLTFDGWRRDGAFIDAEDETVVVSCYPCSLIPEERLPAVAELINLMASAGVNYTVALDLVRGQIKLRNYASFAGTSGDRQLLLQDLIGEVMNAAPVFQRTFDQVAFERVDPAAAFAELERWMEETEGPTRDH